MPVMEYNSERRIEKCGPRRLKEALVQLNRQEIAFLLEGRITLPEGKLVHACIIRSGLQRIKYLGNLLVSMYAKCGDLEAARSVFDKMHQRDTVPWTAMIAAYAHRGHKKEALQLFRQMQQAGVKQNKITFISVLGACDEPAFLVEGEAIHADIVAGGFESDVVVGTALVNMHGKCGNLDEARAVFNKMHQRNVVSWTALITAYAQHGHGREALQLFRQMQEDGVKPNKITLSSVLSACANLEALAEGKMIHTCIVDNGFESDVVVANALVNMYGKCGSLKDARCVFDKTHKRDVISWNSMIATYAQHGHGKKALHLFREMQQKRVKPDKVTFLGVLSACASVAALAEGEIIHAHILDSGFESDVTVGNALVTMYGKCGALKDAHLMFDKMRGHDVVSWNALIAVYAQHGEGKEAFQLFQQMREEDVQPNKVTFVSLLSACSHAGLVGEGRYCFDSMSEEYGIKPTIEHYNCMIDLLGRAGHLDEAEDFIYTIPFQPDSLVWMTLLSACRMHGDVERGKRAAERVIDMDMQKAGSCTLLSNNYV